MKNGSNGEESGVPRPGSGVSCSEVVVVSAEPAAPGRRTPDDFSHRLEQIHQRIAVACARVGRSPDEITLIAVSKTVSPERLRAAIEAGVRVLGENRIQEAADKIPALKEVAESLPTKVEWHLIGHLQSNKARRAVELFDVVQSVDSYDLGVRLNRIAQELNRRLPVFIQVNIGDEHSKSGVTTTEVLPLCEQLNGLAHLELSGLMTVPPDLDNPEEVRPFFRRLRELRDEAHKAGFVSEKFRDLSMGMSHDFEVAIEEGATLVRIGTAIFGAR